MSNVPVPDDVVQVVEQYVEGELSDAVKFDNRAPLDESGIWSLHRLAANIYAKGFEAGTRVEGERQRQVQRRARDQRPARTKDEAP
ncbi:hypothetical protein FZI85_25040 [Mycobacterium sp. CBMA293]|uniref:hypothetical protein n=1 Tax=unclassified Mycolicibacterium TaxID=2636767 RepID=UPI0012DF3DD3|nr:MULTISPECIES: hypothetical protein [unclassified Mycolicibacterium]MUL47583.1 hypothetical protein [Mycolicibacterium sp. CBMA 360]MUL61899.1 hypothetical protein [Mycolicibacterium sp. CBMA 335]MUL68972.1 hypothetical protein [Mycolicibacterium sp. CBMA 311]MUL92811.1 hypothetical protein [Mycolicibacterium sp. CBMA 230]MUM08747.1 hypothetical protein [Mycolicibacterium sp. CBMA 213]